jgi:hypothetical protein
MRRFFKGKVRLILLALGLLLLLGGGVAWLERHTLLTWYYTRELARASGADVDHWADRVASLDERVVPVLLDCATRQEPGPCANARVALGRLLARWGADDPRCVELFNRTAREFPRLSTEGRRQMLDLALGCAADNAGYPAPLQEALARLLPEALHQEEPDAQARAVLEDRTLDLAIALLRRQPRPELLCCGRDLVRCCLKKSASPQTRLKAVLLALQKGMEMRKEMVELLQDPAPAIRRAALLAVGEDDKVILTDKLLPWLHDPDPEVRAVCERVLRARGLTSEHIRLARLFSDPRWSVRLEVLDHLREPKEPHDPEPGVWLRKLTHDVSPAVRVAALRAAARWPGVDLSDRLDQMARADESETVANLARMYLRRR